jgi:hypothetical protein
VHLGLLVGELGLEHPPLDLGDALLLVEAAHALLPRVELGGVAQLALVRAEQLRLLLLFGARARAGRAEGEG